MFLNVAFDYASFSRIFDGCNQNCFQKEKQRRRSLAPPPPFKWSTCLLESVIVGDWHCSLITALPIRKRAVFLFIYFLTVNPFVFYHSQKAIYVIKVWGDLVYFVKSNTYQHLILTQLLLPSVPHMILSWMGWGGRQGHMWPLKVYLKCQDNFQMAHVLRVLLIFSQVTIDLGNPGYGKPF